MSGPDPVRRARLLTALTDSDAQIRDLQAQHADIVSASADSNADDEHDPEGATIAFERQQIVALLDQARKTHADLERALAAAEQGDEGTCERCGRPIGTERLEARPSARSCISCASQRSVGRRNHRG